MADRMSIASASSGSASVSSSTLDKWRPLFKYFINNHPMAEDDKALAEQHAKKSVKALKMIGWPTFDHLINWVKQKMKEKPKEGTFANKQLWNKLNGLAQKGILPSGISKSSLTDQTISYVKKFHMEKSRVGNEPKIVECVDLDDDDDDIGVVVPPLQESQPDLLEQRLYDMFKHRVRQRAYDQNQQLTEDNAIQVTKTVTGIVFDKVGFTGGALMALYACDVKQVRKTFRS